MREAVGLFGVWAVWACSVPGRGGIIRCLGNPDFGARLGLSLAYLPLSLTFGNDWV